jgi:hypothetical protein
MSSQQLPKRLVPGALSRRSVGRVSCIYVSAPAAEAERDTRDDKIKQCGKWTHQTVAALARRRTTGPDGRQVQIYARFHRRSTPSHTATARRRQSASDRSHSDGTRLYLVQRRGTASRPLHPHSFVIPTARRRPPPASSGGGRPVGQSARAGHKAAHRRGPRCRLHWIFPHDARETVRSVGRSVVDTAPRRGRQLTRMR